MKKAPSSRWGPLELVALCWLFQSAPGALAQTGASIVPRPDHVVIVMEENHGFDRIHLSPEAPYINNLAQEGALFISSFALTHPSQPNYLALFSGSTQGIGDDSCPHSFNRPNLASSLIAGGFTFAGYSESLPGVGSGTCESGSYARKHNPWADFVNVPRASNLPFTDFPTDFSRLPDLCFVVPNLDNDMHDGTISQGDSWLRQNIGAYAQWAMTHNSLLILTQDEGHNGTDNRIFTFFVGPMVQPGQYPEHIDHYTLLRTLLTMYGLVPIGRSSDTEPITSCWTPESLNPPLSVSITSPGAGAIFQAPAQVTLTADARSRDSTISKVEFWNGGEKLGISINSPFQLTLTDVTAGDYAFVAKATDALGRTANSTAIRVQVISPDTTPPALKIGSPRANARLSNAVVAVQGTASDAVGVARVEYRVGDGPIQIASGTTNWSAQVELTPGTNAIVARSVDLQGNDSAWAALSLFYVVTSWLTVESHGGGTVTPNLDGQALIIGQPYTVTARPAPGYLFAGWNGRSVNGSPRLTFLMQSNLVVQPQFVPNPFITAKGAYAGLFHEADDVRRESSGFVNITTTESGAFSGSLLLEGSRYALKGQFDLNGVATNSVTRFGSSALSVQLSIDLQGASKQIRGSVSGGSWVALLIADQAVFDPSTHAAPYAGQYTLDFPEDAAPADADAMGASGDGFGAVRVGTDGVARFVGVLADGSKMTAATSVSKDGYWPFYSPLAGGKGFILSWLVFTNSAFDDLQGSVRWIRLALSGGRIYPLGFTNECAVVGSKYTPPAAMSRVMNFTNAAVEFNGGNLPATFTNAVVLDLDNRVRNLGSNRLDLVISLATGTWRGTVTDPFTSQKLSMQGALLQKQNIGVGFFTRSNQTGRVLLRSR